MVSLNRDNDLHLRHVSLESLSSSNNNVESLARNLDRTESKQSSDYQSSHMPVWVRVSTTAYSRWKANSIVEKRPYATREHLKIAR